MSKEAIAFAVCALFFGALVARLAKTDAGFRIVAAFAGFGGLGATLFIIAWDGALAESARIASELKTSTPEFVSGLASQAWGRFLFAPLMVGMFGLVAYLKSGEKSTTQQRVPAEEPTPGGPAA